MSDLAFHKAYKQLNAEQREAVDAIEGPVMVIAGPGTGKTQILTLRTANILRKTDTAPDSILALTFTEAAAANMRKRLVGIIGSSAYYVNIVTFHGFSNHLIGKHPEHFERIAGFTAASKVDRIEIIRAVLDEGAFERLKPFGDPFYHVMHILKGVGHLKKEGYDPALFRSWVERERSALESRDDLYHEKGAHKGKMKGEHQRAFASVEKNEELAEMYEAYQRNLTERKIYDFEDMILEVVLELTRNKEFLLEVQETYQYILVDEHQDTNGSQNKILELIASFYPNPNLFVVGDEKQAIYRFQGASLANFLYFKEKFEGVKLVSLLKNYRSTQAILDAAQSLIAHNAEALVTEPLISARASAGMPVDYYSFVEEKAEYFFITDAVEKLIADGVPPHEIAILYRENKDVLPVADFFNRFGVPFIVESERDILNDDDIRKLNFIFKAVHHFGEDEHLVRALHIDFLRIEPLDLYDALREARSKKMTLHHLLDSVLRDGEEEHGGGLVYWYAKFKEWHTLAHNKNFLEFFETIIRESGLVNHLLGGARRLEKLQKLRTLFDEFSRVSEGHRDYALADYLAYIAILEEHGVTLDRKVKKSGGAVRCMTAHRAKGLEFEYVYIIGAYDGHWGNKRDRTTFVLPYAVSRADDTAESERNEDERRLFFMALTRAKEHVTVTFSRYSPDGKERVPSQFTGEIHELLKREHDGAHYDEVVVERQEILFSPKKTEPTAGDKEFVAEIFGAQGFSPTALNNYLSCPWKYYFRNLVRIPLAPKRIAMYGTAVHEALEDFFNLRNRGEDSSAEFLTRRFAHYLEKKPLSERVFAELLKRGITTLEQYYEFYSDSWQRKTINEYKVNGVILGDVLLRGTIDKIEHEVGERSAIVVDYKTKKPISRNEIEGKTAGSKGDFKRQLVFYKLLLDLAPRGILRMDEGVIDFIEPDDRGRFKQERFEVTDEETDELKEVIRKSAEEILTLSFWDKRCDDSKCEYCALRNLMGDARA